MKLLRHMKFMKHLTAVVTVSFFWGFIVSGCSSQETDKSTEVVGNRLAVITQKKLLEGKNEIRIQEVLGSKWKKVCVLHPYTDVVRLTAIGAEFADFDAKKEIPWALSDSFWTILVVGEDRRVTAHKISRAITINPNAVDLSSETGNAHCVENKSASFQIVKERQATKLKLIEGQ